MNNTNYTEITFPCFFLNWISRQYEFREELLNSLSSYESNRPELMTQDELNIRDQRINDLLSRFRRHYLQYFETKGRFIEADVYTVLSSHWLSTYERERLWITGFKPSLTFRVVSNSNLDLTSDQERRIETVREEIREIEVWLTEEQDRIRREAPVAPPPSHVVATAEEAARERIINRLQLSILVCADGTRVEAITKVIEILNPIQTVKFYVAMVTHQLRMRQIGLRRFG